MACSTGTSKVKLGDPLYDNELKRQGIAPEYTLVNFESKFLGIY